MFTKATTVKILRYLFFTLIPLVVIFIVFAVLNSSKIKKIIPSKDPYHLVRLEKEREELYEKLKSGETSNELYFQLAESAFGSGEIHEAEYFLGKCPRDQSAVVNLKSQINSFKNVRNALERYLFENRNYFDADLTYPEAYGYLDKILDLCPEGMIHVRHLFLKGYLLLREGRRTEARLIYDDLRKNGGALTETSLYLYAKTFMLDDDKSEGIDAFSEFIDRNPDSRLAPLAVSNSAKIHNSQNEPNLAIKMVDSAMKNYSNSEYIPELLLEKERAFILKNNPESINIAVEIFQKHNGSKSVFERANELYDDWVNNKISPNEKKMLLELSYCLIINGRYFQSKKILESLMPSLKGQDLAYARYLLALRNNGAGERDDAIKECKKAIEASPDNNLKSRIYTLMGEIYASKKDVSSAEKYYLYAADSKGTLSDLALREIARVAYDNGWRVKASEYYEKLVDSFPSSPYVSEALNYLVVMSFYNRNDTLTEKYATQLIKAGTNFEDRIKGEYFLDRIGKNNNQFWKHHPLAYYSFHVAKSDAEMFLDLDKCYPNVNEYKTNLGWEYFLAGCYDLAEKEYKFQNDKNDPYARMVLCYLGYFHKQFTDGIISTRGFLDGNYQASVEKGYMLQFYKTAFPIKYTDSIEKYAPPQGFQTSFVLGLIRQESFFNPTVKSSANAIGLMQILPSTGQWISQKDSKKGKFSASKLTEPDFNIDYGIWYLSYLRSVFGNEDGMILAGHNGGPGNLKKWISMFPVHESDPVLFYELIPSRQTRNFVKYVLVNQMIYEKLYKMEAENVYF